SVHFFTSSAISASTTAALLDSDTSASSDYRSTAPSLRHLSIRDVPSEDSGRVAGVRTPESPPPDHEGGGSWFDATGAPTAGPAPSRHQPRRHPSQTNTLVSPMLNRRRRCRSTGRRSRPPLFRPPGRRSRRP